MWIVVVALLALAIGAGIWIKGLGAQPLPRPEGPIAQPRQGAAAPPQGWMELWNQQRAESLVLNDDLKRDGYTDRLNANQEKINRLNRTVPEGCRYNADSLHFEPFHPGSNKFEERPGFVCGESPKPQPPASAPSSKQ
jgi:hypothetical protein